MREGRGESKVRRYEGMQSEAKNGVKKCIMNARLLINLVPDNIWLLLSCKGVHSGKLINLFFPLFLELFFHM